MLQSKILLLWTALVCAMGVLLSSAGCGGTSSGTSPNSDPPDPTLPKIQHVIIVFQENRTPDNLFQGLSNADIANSGVNSKGQVIPLTPVSLANGYDLGHRHADFVNMYDRGRMDGADKIGTSCGRKCPPSPQFKYVNPSEVAPYFKLAETYTFADRMFQTNQGPSFPAHQFIISGTSAPTETSDLFAAENPAGVLNAFFYSGCMAPAGETVAMIDPEGLESSAQYPCFDHATLMDLLDKQSISWKYYTPSAGMIWTGPNAIQHLRLGPDWSNVVLHPAQVLLDIAESRLPAVSWVIPSGQESDHPGGSSLGPSWVASIVNAIGRSPNWSNTAIFITWDDWGGWYDHVAPPIYNSYQYGFRVPLIVVSPYAKAHYVSHVTHDFGSILRFIEENFELSSLGYADSRADDLSDCFDFNQVPLKFQTIAAPLKAQYFLNDQTPPADPDDD